MINDLYAQVHNLGGRIFVVGGYVRDTIRGAKTKDIDLLITGIDIDTLEHIIFELGFQPKLCGRSFGVYKIGNYDIALPRTERSIGDGHLDFDVQVDHTLSVEQDLKRRDFTINAMAGELYGEGLKFKLIDPYGGMKDIQAKTIRQITDTSIAEDYLRALRGIQFASRFGYYIERHTFAKIVETRHLIDTISMERIQLELNKLLLSDNPIIGLQYLNNTGLMEVLLPDVFRLQSPKYNYIYHCFDTYMHTLLAIDNSPLDLTIRLALLLHDIGKFPTTEWDNEQHVYHNYSHDLVGMQMAKDILTKFKYDNQTIDAVVVLIGNHMQTNLNCVKTLRKLMSKIGVELTRKLIQVCHYDAMTSLRPKSDYEYQSIIALYERVLSEQNALKVTDLKVNGYTLMSMGFKGRAIGDELKRLLELVLDRPELNEYNKLVELIKNKGE